MDLVTRDNFFDILGRIARPWQSNYLAMYSSQWQGATRDPQLMMIPADDHLVHRGDGVFEVMRCIRGRIYQMEEHLKRLDRSAEAISLPRPSEYPRLRDLIKETAALGGEKECLVRVLLSRGPGSFSVNPFDCPQSQLYINTVRFKPLPDETYRRGVSACISSVPIKKAFFARIKSCDYLPNVLMKIEAARLGCAYAVSLDEQGCLAEGATENICVLGQDLVLVFPSFQRTLAGTTAARVNLLARRLVSEGLLKDVVFADIRPEDAYGAREILLTGTSINILPVVSLDGRTIGDGRPGAVFRRLLDLLIEDMTFNSDMLTEVPWS
jgi:branched-chain amino acid aminotransferase